MDLSSFQVLVIDDEPVVIQLIVSVLRGMGITHVHRAQDGVEALAFLTSPTESVDLVICDWMMPKMSGLDLLREIRSRNSDLPFLMVTGQTTEDAVLAAKEFGVSAYVVKPFSIGEIERKVATLLEKIPVKYKGEESGES